MIFIANFNNSRYLSDLEELYEDYKGTNINFLMDDFPSGKTRWSVPKNTHLGDVIILMCAKEARHNLGMATSSIPDDYGEEFLTFVDEQKALYKKYSGHILGYGIVSAEPENDGGRWMSDIDKLCQFSNPIYIDDFRSFISISKTNSITYINDEQWERLKWVINQKNPEVFTDVIAPDAEVFEKEFEAAVKKAISKPIDQLRKAAEKNSSKATASTVTTKVYYRDPVIAAYIKKNADGRCQLCGMKAPFVDPDGNPYLECHHIEWLSKGGEDSIYNCVALCPNCHRKIHILNDAEDISTLKRIISENKDV